MKRLEQRLEIFFMGLPEPTKAIYRSDEESLYIGINKNLIPTFIDQIENQDFKIIKAPA
jgi:hypothetical protein